jgi:hypothetical protein
MEEAMKVVKAPEEWKNRQVTCSGATNGCGTVMEVEFSDLKAIQHNGDQREQTSGWVEVYVVCPTCSRHLRIQDVPQWQQAKILAANTPAQW